MVIVPNPVKKHTKSVDVYGSGFSPEMRVVMGVAGILKGEDLLFDARRPSKYGTFHAPLLIQGYGGLRRLKVGPGVYTVEARSEDGELLATTPLVIAE
jgi:hypothetical protein